MIQLKSNWCNNLQNKFDNILYYYNENGLFKKPCNQKNSDNLLIFFNPTFQKIYNDNISHLNNTNTIADIFNENLAEKVTEVCNLSIRVNEKNISIESIDIICSAQYMEIFSGDVSSVAAEYLGTSCGELLSDEEVRYGIENKVDVNFIKNIQIMNTNDYEIRNTDCDFLNNNDVSNNKVDTTAINIVDEPNENIGSSYLNQKYNGNQNIDNCVNLIGTYIKNRDIPVKNVQLNKQSNKLYMLQYSFEKPLFSISVQFKKLQERHNLLIHSIHITFCQSTPISNDQFDTKIGTIPNDMISLFSQMFSLNTFQSKNKSSLFEKENFMVNLCSQYESKIFENMLNIDDKPNNCDSNHLALINNDFPINCNIALKEKSSFNDTQALFAINNNRYDLDYVTHNTKIKKTDNLIKTSNDYNKLEIITELKCELEIIEKRVLEKIELLVLNSEQRIMEKLNNLEKKLKL